MTRRFLRFAGYWLAVLTLIALYALAVGGSADLLAR